MALLLVRVTNSAGIVSTQRPSCDYTPSALLFCFDWPIPNHLLSVISILLSLPVSLCLALYGLAHFKIGRKRVLITTG